MLAKYIKYLQFSTTGYRIIHQRDIDEGFLNILTLNGSMPGIDTDLLITLDHYAVITYIIK